MRGRGRFLGRGIIYPVALAKTPLLKPMQAIGKKPVACTFAKGQGKGFGKIIRIDN
jgi:hypothetical protein